MPALLVRDLTDECKYQLAISAAKHGRSQQAEARAILETALVGASNSWVQAVRSMAEQVGGFDIPLAERHTPRLTGVVM